MEKWDNEEVRQLILTRLEHAVDKEELIYDICEKYQMGWAEAENMVETISINKS